MLPFPYLTDQAVNKPSFVCLRWVLLVFLLLLTACSGALPQVPTETPALPPAADAYPAYPPPTAAVTIVLPTEIAPETSDLPTPTPTSSQPTPLPPEAWPDRYNADSRPIDFSADGRLLLLESDRPLMPGEPVSESGQAAPAPAIYLVDRQAGTYERVIANGQPLTNASDLSPDGRWVVFHDNPEHMGADGDDISVFLLDRQAGTVELISINSAGQPADEYSLPGEVSADGRLVLFNSSATNLGMSPTSMGVPHLYLRDRQAGTTTQIDLGPGGAQPDSGSNEAVMTPDARFVGFISESRNLIDAGGQCGEDCQPGLFVVDRVLDTVERIPGGQMPEMGGASSRISLSADGRLITFHAYRPVDFAYQVHVYDRTTGKTEIICAQVGAACGGHSAEISADGRYVAFTNQQVYLYDRQTQQLTLLSMGLDGLPGRGMSGTVQHYEGYYAELELSATGNVVAFGSDAHSLLSGSADGQQAVKPACTLYPVGMIYPCRDVFIYDRKVAGLDWITRTAQPSVRQAHSALIPPMPEVLLEAAPSLLYINEDQLVRQSGIQRVILADVNEAGPVLDALHAGDWVYVVGQQGVLRVHREGGQPYILHRFASPARRASLVASGDGQQAAFGIDIGTGGQRDEVWFYPGGMQKTRKLFDSGLSAEMAVTLVGLRDDSLYMLPIHPFSALLRIDLVSGETTSLEAGLGLGCCEAALSPDGQTMAVFHPGPGSAGTILRVDLSSGQPITETIPLPTSLSQTVDGFQWSSDSRALYFVYNFLPQLSSDVPFGIWQLKRDKNQVERVANLENGWTAPATLSEDGQWYWLHIDLAGTVIAVNIHNGAQAVLPLPDGSVKLVREQ